MTPFQQSQAAAIREDRRERLEAFGKTGAVAEIGVCSNRPGLFTLNILNGPRARNWDNKPFSSEVEAVRLYAAANFGTGKLRRTKTGSYLVMQATNCQAP